MTLKTAIFAVAICLLCQLTPASAQEAAAPAYDPKPFLDSMVALRTTAETCDPFLAGGPNARTEAVTAFFTTLKQTLPGLADVETQKSLNIFVGSQAALLCRDKLDAAVAGYRSQAATYAESKTGDWPDPPAVSSAPWCSTENCLEF